jgi:hypothetical protein
MSLDEARKIAATLSPSLQRLHFSNLVDPSQAIKIDLGAGLVVLGGFTTR